MPDAVWPAGHTPDIAKIAAVVTPNKPLTNAIPVPDIPVWRLWQLRDDGSNVHSCCTHDSPRKTPRPNAATALWQNSFVTGNLPDNCLDTRLLVGT